MDKGHIERHLAKTDADLIHRLLQDWKVFSGCLYSKPDISNLENQKLHNGRNEVVIDLGYPAGYGFNRMFERIESNFIRMIVEKSEDEIKIITAYPDLDKGVHTGSFYEFNIDDLNAAAERAGDAIYDNSIIWNLFLEYQKEGYQVRFVQKKNPQIRIMSGKVTIKLSQKTCTLITAGKSQSIIHFDLTKEYINSILS